MTTTMTETLVVTEPKLGRVQYIEPDTSADPWECDYFAIPKAKTVTQHIHPLHDLRPSVFESPSAYTLNTHCFTAVKHNSALHSAPFTSTSFYDPAILTEHYVPEIESLVKTVTGAKSVFTLSCNVREKEAGPPTKTVSQMAKERESDPDAEPQPCGLKIDVSKMDLSKTMVGDPRDAKQRAGPARSIHIDFSPNGARENIRNKRMDILEEAADIIEAEDAALAAGKPYEGRRYAQLSVWRPLKTVKKDPLVMCDPSSVDAADLVESKNKQPGVKGDFLVGVVMLQPGNLEQKKWYWIQEQGPDEVIFLQFFDSHAEKEGRPVGVPHGSAELIGAEAEEVRESVECRVIAFW